MNTEIIPVGALSTNCYIISSKENALIIDPGSSRERDIDKILNIIENKNCAILITHGHFDHIGGADILVQRLECPVYGSALCAKVARDPQRNLSGMFHVPPVSLRSPVLPLADGVSTRVLSFDIETFYTPGHSPDSCCYFIDGALYSGDTLFRLSCGNTSFNGGDAAMMSASLQKLQTLFPDREIPVYPGHGESTSLPFEFYENPYFNFRG